MSQPSTNPSRKRKTQSKTTYYHANLDKTQVTVFHLRNREANRSLKVVWNGTELEDTTHPKYFGATLDRTLSYTQNTKMKVTTRNNLLTNLVTSKWGADPHTIRTTALALSYSAAAYAAPVWSRSSCAKNLDPALNQACRSVTGCLKLADVKGCYLLMGIPPPSIKRDVCAREVLHWRHYVRLWKRRRNHEPHDAVCKTGRYLLFG